MIEKRKKRKLASDSNSLSDEPWKPTKLESEVATYLHRKVPTKNGRLAGIVVHTFDGNEAVDSLLDSPWSKLKAIESNSRNTKPVLFADRAAAINYMETLLRKCMFRRAIQAPKKSSKIHADSKSSKSKIKKDSTEEKGSKNAEITQSASAEKLTATNRSSTISEKKDSISGDSGSVSKSSRPMRLELAAEQTFVLDDPLSVYVWVYEPPPGLFNWLAGTALLVAIILCCLFPVWPAELRAGAYYLTLLASGLFGLLIFVALIRLTLYIVVWVGTLGKYAFWLFPNYFEDCGFFDSFRPIYSFRLYGVKSSKKDKMRDKKNRNPTICKETEDSSLTKAD